MDTFAASLARIRGEGHRLLDPYAGLHPSIRAMKKSDAEQAASILVVATYGLAVIDKKRTQASKGGRAHAFSDTKKAEWVKQANVLRKRNPRLTLHAVSILIAKSMAVRRGERRPAPRTIYEHLREILGG